MCASLLNTDFGDIGATNDVLVRAGLIAGWSPGSRNQQRYLKSIMSKSLVGSRLVLPPHLRPANEPVGNFAREMLTPQAFHGITMSEDKWDRLKLAGTDFNASVKIVLLSNPYPVLFVDQTAYILQGMTLGYKAFASSPAVAKEVKKAVLKFELEEETSSDSKHFTGLCYKAKVRDQSFIPPPTTPPPTLMSFSLPLSPLHHPSPISQLRITKQVCHDIISSKIVLAPSSTSSLVASFTNAETVLRFRTTRFVKRVVASRTKTIGVDREQRHVVVPTATSSTASSSSSSAFVASPPLPPPPPPLAPSLPASGLSTSELIDRYPAYYDDRLKKGRPGRTSSAKHTKSSVKKLVWSLDETRVLVQGIFDDMSMVAISTKLQLRNNSDCNDKRRNLIKKYGDLDAIFRFFLTPEWIADRTGKNHGPVEKGLEKRTRNAGSGSSNGLYKRATDSSDDSASEMSTKSSDEDSDESDWSVGDEEEEDMEFEEEKCPTNMDKNADRRSSTSNSAHSSNDTSLLKRKDRRDLSSPLATSSSEEDEEHPRIRSSTHAPLKNTIVEQPKTLRDRSSLAAPLPVVPDGHLQQTSPAKKQRLEWSRDDVIKLVSLKQKGEQNSIICKCLSTVRDNYAVNDKFKNLKKKETNHSDAEVFARYLGVGSPKKGAAATPAPGKGGGMGAEKEEEEKDEEEEINI